MRVERQERDEEIEKGTAEFGRIKQFKGRWKVGPISPVTNTFVWRYPDMASVDFFVCCGFCCFAFLCVCGLLLFVFISLADACLQWYCDWLRQCVCVCVCVSVCNTVSACVCATACMYSHACVCVCAWRACEISLQLLHWKFGWSVLVVEALLCWA